MASRGLSCIAVLLLVVGCDDVFSSDLRIERLPEVQPNLPEVPTLPPAPHPVRYGDDSYSVYGVRQRLNNTINTMVTVTGYIVQIFEPPECPRGRRCPLPPAPHMWIADTEQEAEARNRLRVVGYAESHLDLEEAIADARRGRAQESNEELGIIAIPTDFAVGNKVRVRGQFAYMSGGGFNESRGLLDYRGHETLQPGGDAADGE